MPPDTAVPLWISLPTHTLSHTHTQAQECTHWALRIHWRFFFPLNMSLGVLAYEYPFMQWWCLCVRVGVFACVSVVSRSIVFGRYEWASLVFVSLQALSLVQQAYLSLTLMAIFCNCHNYSVCLKRKCKRWNVIRSMLHCKSYAVCMYVCMYVYAGVRRCARL